MDLILNQLTLAQKTNSELLSKITAMEKNQVRFKFYNSDYISNDYLSKIKQLRMKT